MKVKLSNFNKVVTLLALAYGTGACLFGLFDSIMTDRTAFMGIFFMIVVIQVVFINLVLFGLDKKI